MDAEESTCLESHAASFAVQVLEPLNFESPDYGNAEQENSQRDNLLIEQVQTGQTAQFNDLNMRIIKRRDESRMMFFAPQKEPSYAKPP